MTLIINALRAMVMTQNQVEGQSVQKTEWKRTDKRTLPVVEVTMNVSQSLISGR